MVGQFLDAYRPIRTVYSTYSIHPLLLEKSLELSLEKSVSLECPFDLFRAKKSFLAANESLCVNALLNQVWYYLILIRTSLGPFL